MILKFKEVYNLTFISLLQYLHIDSGTNIFTMNDISVRQLQDHFHLVELEQLRLVNPANRTLVPEIRAFAQILRAVPLTKKTGHIYWQVTVRIPDSVGVGTPVRNEIDIPVLSNRILLEILGILKNVEKVEE